MALPAKPGVADVLAAIVNQIGAGPFLVGLTALCAVIAVNVFAGRTSRLLLKKIEFGAHVQTDRRSGREYFVGGDGRRIYKPEGSDFNDVRVWYGALADNRVAYEKHRRNPYSHTGEAMTSREFRREQRAFEKSLADDDHDDQRRSRLSDY